MQYRIKYMLYRVEADNIFLARKKALSILENNLADLVRIEPDVPQMPFWKRLLTGK